jgi:hypothetical protein
VSGQPGRGARPTAAGRAGRASRSPHTQALHRRRTRRLWWITAVTAAAVATAAVAAAITVTTGGRNTAADGTSAAGRALPAVGSAAPDGSFTTVTGRTETVASLRGHKTLLWFVTTWCSSCQSGTQAMAGQITGLRAAGVRVAEVENYADMGQPGPGMAAFARQLAGAAGHDPGWTFGVASQTW